MNIEQLKPSGSRSIIDIEPDIAPMVDAAEEALILCEQGIFQRGGIMVHVVPACPENQPRWGLQPEGTPIIHLLPVETLRERIGLACDFRSDGKSARPPLLVAQTLLKRGEFKLPVLEATSCIPILRPDGSLFAQSGYDCETGILVQLGDEMEGFATAIPSTLDRNLARAALETLLDPFSDFPFVSDSDRSTFLALLLSIIGRNLIAGQVPAILIGSPTAGTGKSLLADSAGVIATGRTLPRVLHTKDAGEERKRALAMALEGPSAVLLDNVEGELRSSVLAAVLTGAEIKDRVLGLSKSATAALRSVYVVTGNNVQPRGDLARRFLPCTLDAQLEAPDERGGFKNPDLLAYLRENRPMLVAASLTALRARLICGEKQELTPFGSFEAWSDLIRSLLVWTGFADPCEGRDVLRQQADPEREMLRAFFSTWFEHFEDREVSAKELVETEALQDALPSTGRREITARSLGYQLRRFKGRIVGGLRLETSGTDRNGIRRWSIQKCG